MFAAFNHLSNDGRNQDLTGIEMLSFFDTMLKNAQLNSVQYISDVDFEQRSIDLWGSDIEDLSKGSCKWYQVGCHLSNFWNWLNDKPGDGGQSNLQMIGSVLGIVALIIGLLNE